jgi:hypothetical protein
MIMNFWCVRNEKLKKNVPVLPSACNYRTAEQMFSKFHTGEFYKHVSNIPSLIKIVQ